MALASGGDTAKPENLRLRSRLMKEHIAPGDLVLDVGCGRAEYLRSLVTHTPNIFGIETRDDKLQDCFAAHPELRDRLFLVSAESMPFPAAHFDVVIVNEVLEHIADQEAALREIRRVLKPGGKFLLFCPNRFYPFETHGFMICGALRTWIPALSYLPGSVCRFLRFEPVARNYWPREVANLLQRHGFQVQKRTFVQQTFENVSRAQPWLVRAISPVLRQAVRALGKIPVLRAFVSVSSFFVATADPSVGRELAA